MKFFTPAMYGAQYADEGDEIEAIRIATNALNAHITGLGSRFRAELRRFADPYLVDDALLVSATSDRSKRELELVLRCGNIPNGYWDGVFHYYDVELPPANHNVLKKISRGTLSSRSFKFEGWVHELDVLVDGRIEHRLFFHGRPKPVWFTIRCGRLEIRRIPRADRQLPVLSARFVEVTQSAEG